MLRNIRGFAMPAIILGIVILLPLVAVFFSMSREYQNQVSHVDEILRCHSIGISAFNTVSARLREKPYSQRFFYPTAFKEVVTGFNGGSYELYVVDTPGKPMQADIYVSVDYRRVKRLYFWRILIEQSILDAIGRVNQILYTNLAPSQFGYGGPGSTADGYINDILKERNKNRKIAAAKAAQVISQESLVEIAIGIDVPDGTRIVDSIDPAEAPEEDPPLSDPIKLPLSMVYLAEDFEGQTVGQSPSEWNWTIGSGNGAVVSETSNSGSGGGKVLKVLASKTATNNFAIRYKVDPVPEKMLYKYDLFIPNGSLGAGIVNSGVGIVFHYTMGILWLDNSRGNPFGDSRKLADFESDKWLSVSYVIDSTIKKASVNINGRTFSDLPAETPPYSSPIFEVAIIGSQQLSGQQSIKIDNINISGESD